MEPTKASRERHASFRAKVSKMLLAAGAGRKEDGDMVQFTLQNKRIADLVFTMFKRDGEQGSFPRHELYCLFIRVDIDAPDFARQVATVNEQYSNEMGPSGKWNLIFSDPQDVLNELARRLEWLMK